MVEIPDNHKRLFQARTEVSLLAFGTSMPLVLVPLAFTADAKLLSQIDARSSAVKAKVDSINSVEKRWRGLEEFGHPQSDWAGLVTVNSDVTRTNTRWWTYLWDQQKAIRTWPPLLYCD